MRPSRGIKGGCAGSDCYLCLEVSTDGTHLMRDAAMHRKYDMDHPLEIDDLTDLTKAQMKSWQQAQQLGMRLYLAKRVSWS